MAGTGGKSDSLRLNRFETKRLVWALALSVAAHFLVWGGYELGKEYGLWQRLHRLEQLLLAAKKIPPPTVQPNDPTIFLTVDPDQVSPDAPKEAKYYSTQNSRAAQTDASSRDSNQPKLTGRQADVPQTRDVPRTPNTKVQPAPAPQPPSPEKMAAPPKSILQDGDMKLAKLETSPEKNMLPERPRTLSEARAQQASAMPSMTMNQDGGLQRRAIVPSYDVKLTGFADYDARFFQTICQRWWDLLDSQQFARDRTGKVTLEFRLNYDGTISDMKVVDNSVGDLLGYVCQKAVQDPAPFERFPSDMRRKLGDFSSIRIAFYYY
jgi:hypothetical protein